MKTPAPSAPAREVELKLVLPPEALSRIRRAGALSRLPGLCPLGRARHDNLVAVYWDTVDGALGAAGIALRTRTQAGTQTLTVKADARAAGLVADRLEVNAPLPHDSLGAPPDLAALPDPRLRRRLERLVGENRLVPVYETRIMRTARRYRNADGACFEAAIDLGEVCAQGRTAAVSEIELEWRAGSPVAMLDAAAGLARAYPARISLVSKADRARRLVTQDGPHAVTAGPPVDICGRAANAACAAVLSDCVAQIAANQPAILEAASPDGIHQMRVGIRRFRAAMKSFPAAMATPAAAGVLPGLRRVFAILGAARDLDVFTADTLPALAATAPDGMPSMVALAAAAAELRAEAWQDVRAALEDSEFTVLVIDAARLAVMTGEAPAGDPDALADLAEARLERHWRQVSRRARRLDRLDSEGRHDLRKRLKMLRYDVEIFAPLWRPRDVRPMLKPLRRIQDAFGAVNDAATAGAVAARAAKRLATVDAAAAAGFVAGWSAAEAERRFADARRHWEKLAATPPFWAEKARN